MEEIKSIGKIKNILKPEKIRSIIIIAGIIGIALIFLSSYVDFGSASG